MIIYRKAILKVILHPYRCSKSLLRFGQDSQSLTPAIDILVQNQGTKLCAYIYNSAFTLYFFWTKTNGCTNLHSGAYCPNDIRLYACMVLSL